MTIGIYTEVEADTPEQAREIAFQRTPASLAAQVHGANAIAKKQWVLSDDLKSGEADPSCIEIIDAEGKAYEFQDERKITGP